jgi:hypothetical protein
MFAQLIVVLAILALAIADPVKPTLPSQYMVTDINMVMDTNAGYPPHYTEEDSAQYFDFTLQKSRTDVTKASYGQKGSYSIINNYSEMFPVNCSKQYPDVQAPRGYLIAGGQCCYHPLINDCDSNPSTIPMAQTMLNPVLPTKIAYIGTADDSSGRIPAGTNANVWESAIYLKQEVPVLDTFYYFDVNNNNYQLGNFLNVNAGPQFINATTIYNGKWTEGPQAAELFDISDYDCSSMCSSNVAANVLNAGFFHKKH